MTAIFVALLLVTLKAPSQEGQINAQNRATLRSLNAPGSPAFFPSAPLSGNLTRPMAGRPAWIPILGRPSGGGTSTLVPGVPGGAPAHNCDIQDTLDDGFRWLANEQLADGSWPEDTGDKGVAVTGLAMLAFYMNDYTHVGGLYQLHMEKALNFMIHASQANNGDVWHILPGPKLAGAYVQAIATYALAEAYRRTGDPKIRQPTVDCLRVLLAGCNNQTYMGKQKYSWRYNKKGAPPHGGQDMSIHGWVVQAIMDANYCEDITVTGTDINATFEGLDYYHKLNANGGNGTITPTGTYGYEDNKTTNKTMTAAGMLSYQLLRTLNPNDDWHKQNSRKGTLPTDRRLEASKDYLMNTLPKPISMGAVDWGTTSNTSSSYRGYYLYYGTIAMRVYAGVYSSQDWDIWRSLTGLFLCETQSKVGSSMGYWAEDLTPAKHPHCVQAWCLMALSTSLQSVPGPNPPPIRGPIPSVLSFPDKSPR
jgi:hypothetical protein